MDPSVVVWIGILIALIQVAVTKILNYYFPDGYISPRAMKRLRDEEIESEEKTKARAKDKEELEEQ